MDKFDPQKLPPRIREAARISKLLVRWSKRLEERMKQREAEPWKPGVVMRFPKGR